MAERIIFIMTDMEGLSGVDHWDQCYDPDDHSTKYQWGLQQLTAEVNAAVGGAFEGGATEVRVLDGHGRNQNRGLIEEKLDPRAKRVWIAERSPLRFEGIDESIAGVCCIGQHAMAGTVNGFLDHTQRPKYVCRLQFNGQDHGEMSQLAAYAGSFDVPLIYASGDEALCSEARRLFPGCRTTPTKRGTGWASCDLYDPVTVRAKIRRDIAEAVKHAEACTPWKLETPIEVRLEWAYSRYVDDYRNVPNWERVDGRTMRWVIDSQRDVYSWPSSIWHPEHPPTPVAES